MKATDFRIGNIATVCYEDLKPDIIIIIEPGLVQLANRPHPDDERDIAGVCITLQNMDNLKFMEKSKGLCFSIHISEAEGVEISLLIGKYTVRCKYLHELQNVFYCFTGNELIPFSMDLGAIPVKHSGITK
jgi:hypothetical protein